MRSQVSSLLASMISLSAQQHHGGDSDSAALPALCSSGPQPRSRLSLSPRTLAPSRSDGQRVALGATALLLQLLVLLLLNLGTPASAQPQVNDPRTTQFPPGAVLSGTFPTQRGCTRHGCARFVLVLTRIYVLLRSIRRLPVEVVQHRQRKLSSLTEADWRFYRLPDRAHRAHQPMQHQPIRQLHLRRLRVGQP
jgi:hypothetical protein